MTAPIDRTTFGSLHGGDIVLGEDGHEWGVEYVSRTYGVLPGGARIETFTVSLIRHGRRVVGTPIESTPVTVIHRADTALEAGAYQALAEVGLEPEVVAERWSPDWETKDASV